MMKIIEFVDDRVIIKDDKGKKRKLTLYFSVRNNKAFFRYEGERVYINN